MDNFLSEQQLDNLLADLPAAPLPTGFVAGVMSQLPETQSTPVPTVNLEFRLQWIDFLLPIGVMVLIMIFPELIGQDFSRLFGWFDQTTLPLISGQPLASNWVSITVLLALLQTAVFATLAWYWLDNENIPRMELTG